MIRICGKFALVCWSLSSRFVGWTWKLHSHSIVVFDSICRWIKSWENWSVLAIVFWFSIKWPSLWTFLKDTCDLEITNFCVLTAILRVPKEKLDLKNSIVQTRRILCLCWAQRWVFSLYYSELLFSFSFSFFCFVPRFCCYDGFVVIFVLLLLHWFELICEFRLVALDWIYNQRILWFFLIQIGTHKTISKLRLVHIALVSKNKCLCWDL